MKPPGWNWSIVNELSDTVFDQDRAELRLLAAMRNARREGLTWEQIGRALGLKRAGAYDRYKRLSKKWAVRL